MKTVIKKTDKEIMTFLGVNQMGQFLGKSFINFPSLKRTFEQRTL
jgi:hypothetical protein